MYGSTPSAYMNYAGFASLPGTRPFFMLFKML